ncbi:hypothetical protein [Candidatus Hecatella orcuttiae]|uniref:hypothetical protein n=1 Tax=Candidatus Hecatella orcuttiae TaxID=1935119 RepID=UPI002867CC29|nr:hypothetical protein [Candidatus Hecatella orcuttiae]
MAEAFRKAVEYVEKKKREGITEAGIQLGFPEFGEGTFKVNRLFAFNPLILGMYSDRRDMVKFDAGTVKAVKALAGRLSLKMEKKGLNIYLSEQGVRVAWLKQNFFGASKPELFVEIGKAVYGLKA